MSVMQTVDNQPYNCMVSVDSKNVDEVGDCTCGQWQKYRQ